MSDWMEELFTLAQRQSFGPSGDEDTVRISDAPTFRVSDLLIPAALVVRNRKWRERPEHPRDGVAAMIGTAVHTMVSETIGHLCYLRIDDRFQNAPRMWQDLTIDGTQYTVIGQPDFFVDEGRTMVDLKTCKYGAPMKMEWIWQLWIYAWLWRKQNTGIRPLESIGILKLYKNWSPENPRQKGGPWEFEPVEMVSDEAVERFIRYRIGLILKAREGASDCPPNDRWGTVTVRPDGMTLVENPKRRQFYCKHRDYCPQWEQEQALGPVPMKPVSFEPPEDWE